MRNLRKGWYTPCTPRDFYVCLFFSFLLPLCLNSSPFLFSFFPPPPQIRLSALVHHLKSHEVDPCNVLLSQYASNIMEKYIIDKKKKEKKEKLEENPSISQEQRLHTLLSRWYSVKHCPEFANCEISMFKKVLERMICYLPGELVGVSINLIPNDDRFSFFLFFFLFLFLFLFAFSSLSLSLSHFLVLSLCPPPPNPSKTQIHVY